MSSTAWSNSARRWAHDLNAIRFAIAAIKRALKDHPAALDAILKELAEGDDEKLN